MNLPLTNDTTGYDILIGYMNDRLSLFSPKKHGRHGLVYAEFIQGAAGYRRKQGKKEMLLKAIGLHRGNPLTVLDATGGLGRDSFLMASQGCRVYIVERNRIVAALLEDGLQRAAAHPVTSAIIERIKLSVLDCNQFLRNAAVSEQSFDVIYLDPMFPRRSKSALVKKEMQLLQKLIRQDSDTELLFNAALAAARRRVVVKRPQAAPPLCERKPSHTIGGRTTRFDVYLIPGAK